MPDYQQDDDGVVHGVLQYGQGDFTYCGRDYSGADGPETQTFEGNRHSGPATCMECKVAFDRQREGMKGTRWARMLVSGMPDDETADAPTA